MNPLIANGKMDVVCLGNVAVGWAIFVSGWRWSEKLKSITETKSCQVPHTGKGRFLSMLEY
jgi:hypothetical protein